MKHQTVYEQQSKAVKNIASQLGVEWIKGYKNHMQNCLAIGRAMGHPISNPSSGDYKNAQREQDAINAHFESGQKHYVIAKYFYSVISSGAAKVKLDNMPTELLIGEEKCFQMSLPNGDKYIVDFNEIPEGNLFNMTVYGFRDVERCQRDNLDNFFFYIFKMDKKESCQSVLDEHFDRANIESGDREVLSSELSRIFPELVNLILYLNTGKPDLRAFKNLGTYNKTQNIRNGVKSKRPYVVVGYNFKKETYVNPYFRWQPHGSQNSLRRWQLISGSQRSCDR